MEERFETFTVLINSISRSIHKLKTAEMAEFNLKSSHVSCLYYLFKQESLTAKELCDICSEDKANISRSVRYLEENGYLSCHSKTLKRYQSPLTLTDKGREIGARIVEKIDRNLAGVSEGLTEEHRRIMYESLARVNDNLKKISEICGESAAVKE